MYPNNAPLFMTLCIAYVKPENETKRTAVVIGVGAQIGLGAALCRRFAPEGLHVQIAGRTPSKLEPVAKAISAADGSAEAVTMDTTNEADVVKHAARQKIYRSSPHFLWLRQSAHA